jgi:uncharacterized membrane protein YfcA
MESYLIVFVVALFASALALYSGFGLATLLMPVLLIFFPPEVAVAATALVHGLNNLFKIALVGKFAEKSIVLHFGLPAIAAAFFGAWLLAAVVESPASLEYSLGDFSTRVTLIKLVMAVLIFSFAMFELLPALRAIKFDRKYLPLGGILSGFFGGLSGHQGALRSAFLIKSGIKTETFVGTNAVIGLLVDVTRIAGYLVFIAPGFFVSRKLAEQWPLITAALTGAIIGVLIGKQFLHKVTLGVVQTLVGFLLVAIAAGLGLGLI